MHHVMHYVMHHVPHQLLHDELVARRASMVAHLLRLPDRFRDHPRVEELTEAQYNRLLRMLVIKRPRSAEEVEL